MSIFIIKAICPTILFISVFYPYWRGLRGVKWWKSILLGWAFFVAGCLFREYLAPFLAEYFIGMDARNEVACINSYMVFGIALGWLFPLVFHGMGVFSSKALRRQSQQRSVSPSH